MAVDGLSGWREEFVFVLCEFLEMVRFRASICILGSIVSGIWIFIQIRE